MIRRHDVYNRIETVDEVMFFRGRGKFSLFVVYYEFSNLYNQP